jgi:hypothetical protein
MDFGLPTILCLLWVLFGLGRQYYRPEHNETCSYRKSRLFPTNKRDSYINTLFVHSLRNFQPESLPLFDIQLPVHSSDYSRQ